MRDTAVGEHDVGLPMRRLAGVYAMARLADDWAERRQECVDVLCAYLRMPWSWEALEGQDVRDYGEDQVRTSILEIIAARIDTRTTSDSWSGLRFNFTNAVLPRVKFMRCLFKQRPNFTGSRFVTDFYLAGTFDVGADFNAASFDGRVIMGELVVKTANVNFDGATFAGWTRIEVEDLGPQAALRLDGVRCKGMVEVHTRGAAAPQGKIDIHGLIVDRPRGSFTLHNGFNADYGTNRQIINPGSWIDDLSFDGVRLPDEWNSIQIADNDGDAMSQRWFVGDTPPVLM